MAQPTKVKMLARAKVNLCLHVTGKRDDGYHLLDSLVVFPEIGDVLTVSAADTLTMTIDGPFSDALSPVSNSVKDAARMIANGRGASVQLTKNLPVASGIGGGSSDAAAALNLLADHWNTPLPNQTELLELGADLPVCMTYKPKRMQGVGDILSAMPNLPKFAIVLVNSGGAVSTANIFGALTTTENTPISPFTNFETQTDLFNYLATQRNDLFRAAAKFDPDIRNIINSLSKTNNCSVARMSGSGGTCFGLFPDIQSAKTAQHSINQQQPDWWVASAQV